MTSEDYVILMLFLGSCNLEDFRNMFQKVNFEIKDDTQLMNEFEFAKTNFELWCKRYNETELIEFLKVAEDFDGN